MSLFNSLELDRILFLFLLQPYCNRDKIFIQNILNKREDHYMWGLLTHINPIYMCSTETSTSSNQMVGSSNLSGGIFNFVIANLFCEAISDCIFQ